MSEEVKRLAGKLGLDTTDFKTALAGANRELRVLESGFRAGASALQDWTQDATGLESRIKTLNSQIDVQKLKVDALRAEHKRLAEENGAGSRAAQDAEIKLNKETETLNNMQNELGATEKNLESVKKGNKDVGDSAEEGGKKVQKFKDILGGLGSVAKATVSGVLAVGAAAVATVALMGGLALSAAHTGDEFQTLSDKTGIAAERLQELNFAGEILGTSLDTITGANARLIRSMAEARDQAGDYAKKLADAKAQGKGIEDIDLGDSAKAFKELGVSVVDSTGKLRASDQVFADLIDALGRVQNPAERDALSMQLFGKSAQELNPLIKAGSAELARLSQEAHKVGAVMGGEGVDAAASFQDQLDELRLGFVGIVQQIGLAFIPGLSGLAGQAKGYLEQLVGVVGNSGGDVGKIVQGMGALFGRIIGDLAKQTPQLLQVGLGIVQSVLNAILAALPSLIPAAVSMITSLVQFIVQALPLVVQAAIQIIMALVNGLLPLLPQLVDVALKAIVTLANGLSQAAPELIPAVVTVILQIVEVLLENAPLLISAALLLITALVHGLVDSGPLFFKELPVIVQMIADVIVQNLPIIAQAAGELIAFMVMAMIERLPLIVDTAFKIMGVLNQTFSLQSVLKTLWNIGAGLVQGIWKGIQDNAATFKANLTKFFTDMVQTIKNALGIHSPSRPMIDIAKNLTRDSFGNTFFAEMEVIRKKMSQTMLGLAQTAGDSASSGLVQTQAIQNDSFDFFGPVIFQDQAPNGLSSAIKGRRF